MTTEKSVQAFDPLTFRQTLWDYGVMATQRAFNPSVSSSSLDGPTKNNRGVEKW